jgi:hypothetical protein
VASWLLRGTGARHESIEDGRQRGLSGHAMWLPRAILLDACIVCGERERVLKIIAEYNQPPRVTL